MKHPIVIVVVLILVVSFSSVGYVLSQVRPPKQNSQLQWTPSKKLPKPQLVFLSGKVNISASSFSHPNLEEIVQIFFFNSTNTSVSTPDNSTLSSAIYTNGQSPVGTYQLWIVVGKTYTVKIYWAINGGIASCGAGTFIPNTTSTIRDFSC